MTWSPQQNSLTLHYTPTQRVTVKQTGACRQDMELSFPVDRRVNPCTYCGNCLTPKLFWPSSSAPEVHTYVHQETGIKMCITARFVTLLNRKPASHSAVEWVHVACSIVGYHTAIRVSNLQHAVMKTSLTHM